jgi:glycosyltransferase involved in cell wall biosynthesis
VSSEVTVILSGHLPWWKECQTPHAIASLLSRRVKVIYVEPRIAWDPSNASFAWKRNLSFLRRRLRQIHHKFWVFTPFDLPLGRFPRVSSWNDQLFRKAFEPAAGVHSTGSLILWMTETKNSPLLARMFPKASRIFHAMDLLVDEAEARTACQLARGADLVLAASPLIAQFLRGTNTSIHIFPNAWEFPRAALADLNVPETLTRVPKPRVGLVAFLSPNLDYALLQKLVETLPASLVCLGRPVGRLSPEDRRCLNWLQRSDRVYFAGELATEALPPYLRSFDVCIAPYKKNRRIYASDPLKIYQYLAVGKPVVTTPVQVLENLDPLVRVGHDDEEFIRHVGEAINTPTDAVLTERRLRYAENNSWEKRWEQLHEVLALHPKLSALVDSSSSFIHSSVLSGTETQYNVV